MAFKEAMESGTLHVQAYQAGRWWYVRKDGQVQHLRAGTELTEDESVVLDAELRAKGTSTRLVFVEAGANAPGEAVGVVGEYRETRRATTMNAHERSAWRLLGELGAARVSLGGKAALDVRKIRVNTDSGMAVLADALVQVVGRSGANRWHQDRYGRLVYVVTDDAQASK